MKAKSSCCQPISPRRLRGERRVGLALVSRRIAGRIIGFLRFARKKPRVWNLCGLGTERVSPRTSPILAKLGSRRRSPRPAEILGDAARGLGGREAEALVGRHACGRCQPGPVGLLPGRVHVPIQRAPVRGHWEALRASPAASCEYCSHSVWWCSGWLALGSLTDPRPSPFATTDVSGVSQGTDPQRPKSRSSTARAVSEWRVIRPGRWCDFPWGLTSSWRMPGEGSFMPAGLETGPLWAAAAL